jgi:hypothetical protein
MRKSRPKSRREQSQMLGNSRLCRKCLRRRNAGWSGATGFASGNGPRFSITRVIRRGHPPTADHPLLKVHHIAGSAITSALRDILKKLVGKKKKPAVKGCRPTGKLYD